MDRHPGLTRRQWLGASATAAAAPYLIPSGVLAGEGKPGASGRLIVGMIGVGGMGTVHLKNMIQFRDEGKVAIAAVCEADEKRLAAAVKLAGEGVEPYRDYRSLLRREDIDAVVIATPDHRHAVQTVHACECGKHVYVEKPCSHNIREGRLMVEAARRYGRTVQVGTQSRSAAYVARAMELLHEGAIGEVLVAKAWNSQLRRDIGKRQPEEPPQHLDFDLWVGPAPMVPYQSNLLHASWRWFLAFGTGDIGNDGVHDMDLARWGLGVETHPNTVAAIGGKYFFADDQQFPDTQYVVFEYGTAGTRRKQLVYEQRLWSPYVQEGYENGNAFYGTEGLLVLGKHEGWQLYGPRNELRDQMKGRLDGTLHHRDFLDCLKTGRRPNADIEIGHLSATLAHLGTIATRVGRVIHFDPQTEQIIGDGEADGLVRRTYRAGHWAVPKGI